MNTNTPMVSIRCITYNHEPYIRQCLEGFVMQKTNFRFEAIVHDDASTDRTADIIREYAAKYPNIIKPIYETENQYSKRDGSLRRIMDAACTGKYIALCEGDDYWIDPLKLQKQVDFLEANPEYGMCCGNAYKYREIANRNCGPMNKGIPQCSDNDNREDTFNAIALGIGGLIVTGTVIYRNQLRSEIIENDRNFMMGDTPMWLDLSQLAKIKYVDEILSVYRIHEGSVSKQNSFVGRGKFKLSMFEMRIYYYRKYRYPLPNCLIKEYRRALCNLMVFDDNIKILFAEVLSNFDTICINLVRARGIKIIARYYIILHYYLRRLAGFLKFKIKTLPSHNSEK